MGIYISWLPPPHADGSPISPYAYMPNGIYGTLCGSPFTPPAIADSAKYVSLRQLLTTKILTPFAAASSGTALSVLGFEHAMSIASFYTARNYMWDGAPGVPGAISHFVSLRSLYFLPRAWEGNVERGGVQSERPKCIAAGGLFIAGGMFL